MAVSAIAIVIMIASRDKQDSLIAQPAPDDRSLHPGITLLILYIVLTKIGHSWDLQFGA